MGEMLDPLLSASELTAPLAAQARQTYTLLGVSPFAIDGAGKIHWADGQLASRLLRAPEALLPRTEDGLSKRLDLASAHARKTALSGLTWDGARYVIEYQIDLYDGQKIWVEERGQRLSGQGRAPVHIAATLSDIDARKKDETQKVYRSSHDPLTGLWNEARLREGLIFFHASAKAFSAPSVFLRLQLSNLAHINSSYGYEVGDRILNSVAARLSEACPAPHMSARIGAASFAVCLMNCAESEIVARAEALRQRLSDVPYSSPHGDLLAEFVISSVTSAPDEETDIDALFAKSNLALEAAANKTQKYLAYSAALHGRPKMAARQETTAEDVIAALNDRRISLAYQPIIDAKTHALHHYECLMRLKTDGGDIVSAGSFIMAAERLGLVHLLDRRALEIASQTLTRYPDIHLALNVSAATVKDGEAAQAYLDALQAIGPAAPRVTIELTETVALEDPAMASRFSVEARFLGCEFSIDDFGSGHTTFQNLMAIEADSIKIDGSFVKDLSITPHKQTFVRMMVDLAQTFSVKTVAEMVETREDAELLKRLGVDYLQGYLFGVPSPAPAWPGPAPA